MRPSTLSIALVLAAMCAHAAWADDPPNVLLIIADDLGVADIGAYTVGPNAEPGNPPPTPNIDALAASGVLFREAWSAPVCSPTRATLYTGRYGLRTGVRDVNQTLPASETTFAELIGPSGYANGLFGKWHLGDSVAVGGDDAPRVSGGWDWFEGTLGGGIGDYYSFEQVVNGVTVPVNNYATSENVDDALAWIGAQTTPWTCTIAFNTPHSPFHAPPEELFTLPLGVDPHDIRLYRAMIEAMDTEIGRLLAGLGASRDNTVVIFVGDNGTPDKVTQSPYTTAKGSVYEGGVHVPLVIAGPGVAPGGREVDTPVHVADLFSTIADYAGVDPAVELPGVTIDGLSLRGLLEDPNAVLLRETIYTERVADDTGEEQYAVRDARYKLVEIGGVQEMYDLADDPLETSDLLTGTLSPEQQVAFESLQSALDELLGVTICDADLNADGVVDLTDLAVVLANYGQGPVPPAAAGDVNGDGATNLTDLGIVLVEYDHICR